MGRRKHKDKVCKEMEYMAQFVHKCDCGHSMYLSPAHPKRICRWCGNMVYLDKKEEFKEKLKILLKNKINVEKTKIVLYNINREEMR